MAIAAHPENTKSIVAALEEATEQATMAAAATEEGWSEWGEEISDEEIENWEPYSKQSQAIIETLRRDGFIIADD